MKIKKQQQMYDGLKTITKYMTIKQLLRDCKKHGIDYEEYLEMAYENVLHTAKFSIKGLKRPDEDKS